MAARRVVFGSAGGGTQTRATATATTSSLAPTAQDTTSTITLAKAYRLYSVQASRPARIRLYDTAAHRTADAGRSVGSDPAADAGVILDFYAADTTAHTLSPLVDGANLETVPTTAISMAVTNNDVATGTVTVTLSYLPTE